MKKIYENARRKRKDEIIAAFWEQYKNKPIEKITIKSITQACNIHRATFYIHYQDVYAVLEEIEHSLLHALDEINVISFEVANDMEGFSNTLYRIYQDNREYLHYLVIENKDPDFSEKYKNQLKDIFPNIFQADSNNDKCNWFIDMTIAGIVDMFLQGADKATITSQEILLLVDGFMRNGIIHTMVNDFDIKSKIDFQKHYPIV